MITQEELNEFDKLDAARTQGEWMRVSDFCVLRGNEMLCDIDETDSSAICRARGFGAGLPQEENLDFIAGCSVLAPKMRQEIARLQSLIFGYRPESDEQIYATDWKNPLLDGIRGPLTP